ncbi:MAG TPA: serine hydrolase domain-containing protein, partial [Paludibacteraceae bacterium]|nr:serine hydrolase domain-containing protein [Paludibacteraceae bacterium]
LLSCATMAKNNGNPQKFKHSEGSSAAFDTERLARLDTVFQDLVRKGEIPHAVTFVAHRGNIVHFKAFGWRDKEKNIPCQRDDIFRMASQTKAITATGVLMLMEEGKILLDDPVKKYIPEFAHPQVLVSFNEKDSTYTTRPANKDITIRHLLTHTSGISYGTDPNNPMMKIFAKKGIPPLNSLDPVTLKEVVKKLASCPLEHDPGERFTYGMSVDVLGYLIEVVSKMPVDQYFKEKIFMPLGMNDTYFYVPKEKQNRMVTLYQKEQGKPLQPSSSVLYQTFPYSGAQTLFSTGAGLSGTIEDYAKFCQMILNKGEFNGKRILGRKTVELMCRNQVGDLRGEIGFGLAFDDFRSQYLHLTMASEGSLRWGGMFGTDYLIDPKEDLILLFYINWQTDNSVPDVKVLFHNLVYQALK